MSTLDLIKAIKTFTKGSTGGPDGLQPQHLLDLTGASAGEGGALPIQTLTNFANQVLANETPETVRPFFWSIYHCSQKRRMAEFVLLL